MVLPAGSQLGPYEVVAPLGAGGMGEVYRARDPRLNREVAVKVLPADLADDPDRLARFSQEARAAGQLNHPNILAVYDVGAHEGRSYVVSELLEGETLRERLGGAAISPRKAVEIAIPIAHGLAAAHDRGIVHRDLKPENLFITPDGRVKILDFGLAKLTQIEGDGSSVTSAPTAPVKTGEGVVMGTVGYMSPEQVRGKQVDHRSDIFTLGAILYEMVTGRKAFQGETPADTMGAILKEEPPEMSESAAHVPPGLDRIVRHCMEKQPAERFQSAQDLAFQLEAVTSASVSGAVALPQTRDVRRPLLLGLGAVAAVALGVAIGAFLMPRSQTITASGGAMRFSVSSPPGTTAPFSPLNSVISPDGRTLAMVCNDSTGQDAVWLRPLRSLDAERLTGTEGAYYPFWSPDGRYIGFFADGKMRRIPVSGGSAQALADAVDARGGSWGAEGTIIYAPGADGPIYMVPEKGGEPVAVTALDSTRQESAHRWPSFLPDGRHFTFMALPGSEGRFPNYVGSTESDERRMLVEVTRAVVYVPPDYIVYVRDDMIQAQRIDLRRLEPVGDPAPIAPSLESSGNTGEPVASGSARGILEFLASPVSMREMVWFDREGRNLGKLPSPPGRYTNLAINPDGHRLAYSQFASQYVRDVWVLDLDRNVSSRVTFEAGDERDPLWSPDGKELVFAADWSGPYDLYRKRLGDPGTAELLYQSDVQWKFPNDWSPDGRYIVFNMLLSESGSDIWLLELGDEVTAKPLLDSRFNEAGADISPDGRWLLYTSDESGRQEVYVQAFPHMGQKYQVTNTGAFGGWWQMGGREIAFVGNDRKNRVVDVLPGETFRVGPPRIRFTWGRDLWDRLRGGTIVEEDGRFLGLVVLDAGQSGSPTIVVNWTAALEEE